MRSRSMVWLAAIGVAVLVVGACAPREPAAKGPIRIGSKIDTEGNLLGNIIKLMLDDNGFETVDRIGTGQTDVVRKALTSGEIDVYPEYTASAFTQFFKAEALPEKDAYDAEKVYETVKRLDMEKNDLAWLARAPANNTWAVAVQRSVSGKEGVSTWDDFARFVTGGGKVKVVGSAEFFDRADAFKNYEKTYGFTLDKDQRIVLSGGDTAQTAKAASRGTGGANAAMVYGTDAGLDALGLVVLKDTKGAQPVYQPAPVVRQEILERYPEIAGILDPVFATLDEATLQKLNGEIALEGKPAADVARAYLLEKGFLQ